MTTSRTEPQDLANAVTGVGIGALASCLFMFTSGTQFRLVELSSTWVAILALSGIAAIVLAKRGMVSAAVVPGGVLLFAGLLQLAQFGRSSNLLGGNSSSSALALGLGMAMVLAGVLARHDSTAS